MRIALCAVLACCAALLHSSAGHAAPIIINPGFELNSNNDPGYGSITGWTGAGGGTGTNTQFQAFNSGHNIPEGTQVAFAQGVASISQDVSGFVTGQQYQLTYREDSRGNSATAASIAVLFDGATIVAAHDVSATADYAFVTSTIFTYTGVTGTGTLTLESLRPATNGTDDNTALFDNIQIAQVPEPASLVLFGLGAIGLFAVARRRRAA